MTQQYPAAHVVLTAAGQEGTGPVRVGRAGAATGLPLARVV